MSNSGCSFTGDREHVLIGYIYGEIDPAEQAAFESHCAVCQSCREEIAELHAARTELGRWASPEPAAMTGKGSAVPFTGPSVKKDSRTVARWWHDVPAWAQAAAAVLFLGAAAGVANLDVRYDHDGLTVRTGWLGSTPAATRSAVQTSGQEAVAVAAPWRSDLAALEHQLRRDFQIAGAVNTSVNTSNVRPGGVVNTASDETRRMRALVAESERRQQRELALRIAEVIRDVHTERQADLVKIDRSLGIIQNNTGVEVMRQRQLLNSLAVRVSQRQ